MANINELSLTHSNDWDSDSDEDGCEELFNDILAHENRQREEKLSKERRARRREEIRLSQEKRVKRLEEERAFLRKRARCSMFPPTV